MLRAGQRKSGSAGLAVRPVRAAAGAELRELEPVGVVPTVLLRDVVAVLAFHARERDLGANVGALAGHGKSFGWSCMLIWRCLERQEQCFRVAGAGLEPATPRL